MNNEQEELQAPKTEGSGFYIVFGALCILCTIMVYSFSYKQGFNAGSSEQRERVEKVCTDVCMKEMEFVNKKILGLLFTPSHSDAMYEYYSYVCPNSCEAEAKK